MLKVRLVKGSFAIVDDEDIWVMAFKWRERRTLRTSYAVRDVQLAGKKKTLLMHREILRKARLVVARYIDHRDGNGLNNTRHNLRAFDPSQKGAFRKLNSNNKTGFRGVRMQYPQRPRPYAATICLRRRNTHLGCFKTAREAALAYDRAAVKAFGEAAFLNFPRRKRSS